MRHKSKKGTYGTATGLLKKGGKFSTIDPAEEMSKNDTIIIWLLKTQQIRLSEWEKEFLTNIYGLTKLTDNQQSKLDQILGNLKKVKILMCDRCGKRIKTNRKSESDEICPRCGDIMGVFSPEEIERLEKSAEKRLSAL